MMDYLFEIKGLSVAYDNFFALRDVNFRVGINDYVGVIGPNGGGKTTLLKVILGIIKPVKGEIIFNPGIINGSGTGYLPQLSTGDLSYPVSVTDVILSGMMIRKKLVSRMSKNDRKRAEEIIDELGLREVAGSSLNELSGGQLQKVFLGRAIIGNPKLLLLDEPGNFVDSNFEIEFYEKLKDLNKRMAILMVSHDIGMISAHVKSFACVNRGLHYHPSSEITNEQLVAYGCPIKLITHGDVPHTVLKTHS